MITTKTIDVVIRVTLQVNTEELSFGVTGGAEDEDAVEEAVNYAVQEMEYSMEIDEPGILVLKTNLESYS